MVPASRPVPFLWLSTGVLLAALLAPTAQANGCTPEECIPIVPFLDVPYLEGQVAFERFAVTVTVRDAVAVTALELTVRNEGTQAVQAHVNLPLPDGAAVLGFNLTVGDKLLVGRMLEKGAAQEEYNNAVAVGVDAALLTQADKRLVALDLNVAPGESRVLRAAYAEAVPLAGGARVYRLPLEQLDPRPAAFDIAVDVSSRLGAMDLKAIGLTMDLPGGKGHATTLPATPQDLLLTWREEAGARSSLVAAAPLDDGATYVLGTICLDGAPLGRDVAFILDQSGSMSGLKIEEARQALVAAIGTVTPIDRFTVVPFSDGAVPFDSSLQSGTSSKVSSAQSRAAALGIEGGTNIDAALQEAFRQLGSSGARLPMVVLLTDGLPTVGVTDHEEIIRRAETANDRDAPIIVVPIGLDADYTFLADLALRSGGAYVDPGAPDAQLSDRLARLAQVLAGPVASDVALTIDGAEPGSIFPKVLPPVYAEDCLEVRFRSDGDDAITVHLQGTGGEGPVSVTQVFVAADVPVQPAVRNLWGQAVVAELLSQERAAETASLQLALKQSVIANATAFGVLTPYTAWVLADDQPAPQPVSQEAAGAATMSYSGAATGTHTQASSPQGGTGSSALRSAYDVDDTAGSQAQNAASATGDTGKASKTPGIGPVAVLVVLALAALAVRRRID